MSLVAEKFDTLRKSGRKGFISYLTAGDPSLPHTHSLVHALMRAGVDLIEMGVPFSDPLADGPVIQRASQRALDAGTNLQKILELVAVIRKEPAFPTGKVGAGAPGSPGSSRDVPIVLFSYLNPIWQMGFEPFARRAKEVGVDGVLLTDLTPEEAGAIKGVFDSYDLDLIFLIAPTSTEERIRRICSAARGFVYAISRTGTTGAQELLSQGVDSLVMRIRRHTTLPIAVGFGISSSDQVQAVWKVADAAVVGSAIVRAIDQEITANGGIAPGEEVLARKIEAFVKGLASRGSI